MTNHHRSTDLRAPDGSTAAFPRLALVFAACFLGGCFLLGKDGIVSFDVRRDISEQQVDGNLLGGLLGGLLNVPIDLEVDLEEETRAQGTGPARHVYLSELRLDITSTAESGSDSDDFGFLDSIEIYVESRDPSSTLPRQRIAHRDSVPDGARSLPLTVEDVDLIEYVNEGARLTASASGHAPIDDVTFDGRMILTVEVL